MLWSRAILGAAALAVTGVSAFSGNTTEYIDDLFDQSMSFLDQIYDPNAGYLWYFYYPLAAGKHETRSTVWYAAGLLRRNEGDDVDNAVKIITNVIGDQQKNVSAQWYEDCPRKPQLMLCKANILTGTGEQVRRLHQVPRGANSRHGLVS